MPKPPPDPPPKLPPPVNLGRTSRHVVYVLDCESASRVKVGYTGNLLRRQREHEREHGPLTLKRCWAFDTRPEAELFERALQWHLRDHAIASTWTDLCESRQTEWFDVGALHHLAVDPAELVKAYKATRVVEVRLPKTYLIALKEYGLSVEDMVRLHLECLPSRDE